ncbi:MAG: MFS transporter [Gammaproteobacteria bacterium]|nr:MFS transporter [Gammaproteobacteria bacterium]
MRLNGATPYWRLSSFYFFYFASLGALIPYWSLYLKSLGYSAQSIGVLMAIIPATKIFAPYLWGWLADHTRHPITIIRLANLLAVVVFAGVFVDTGFVWLMLVLFAFSFFWNSSLPLFEAMTLNHLGDDEHKYSVIRLWGSLGFILMVVLLGEFFDTAGIDHAPVVILVLLAGILLASLIVPERLSAHHEDQAHIVHVIRQPVVLAFLLVCFLMLMSHGPYYTFYSIYLESHGYSRGMIGLLWAVGVMAEVIVFLMMHRLLRKVAARQLLLVTFVLTALRWLLIGFFVDNLSVLFFAQLFHAFSFGVFHAVSISLVHRFFTGSHQGRGQALYASLSFGAGGAVGSLISGLLWDQLEHAILFTLAAAVAMIAFMIVWRFIPLRVDLHSPTAA